jgi:hypothetical protein
MAKGQTKKHHMKTRRLKRTNKKTRKYGGIGNPFKRSSSSNKSSSTFTVMRSPNGTMKISNVKPIQFQQTDNEILKELEDFRTNIINPMKRELNDVRYLKKKVDDDKTISVIDYPRRFAMGLGYGSNNEGTMKTYVDKYIETLDGMKKGIDSILPLFHTATTVNPQIDTTKTFFSKIFEKSNTTLRSFYEQVTEILNVKMKTANSLQEDMLTILNTKKLEDKDSKIVKQMINSYMSLIGIYDDFKKLLKMVDVNLNTRISQPTSANSTNSGSDKRNTRKSSSMSRLSSFFGKR